MSVRVMRKSIVSEKVGMNRKGKVGNPRPRYWDERPISVKLNREIRDLMDYWIKNPVCIDADKDAPLFDNRSHFIKCAIIREFERLKSQFGGRIIKN